MRWDPDNLPKDVTKLGATVPDVTDTLRLNTPHTLIAHYRVTPKFLQWLFDNYEYAPQNNALEKEAALFIKKDLTEDIKEAGAMYEVLYDYKNKTFLEKGTFTVIS